MHTSAQAIEQTRKWITNVVIACNFCPFAAKEIRQNSIHYQVEVAVDTAACLHALIEECKRMDADKSIATSLLIFTNAFKQFDNYLAMVGIAEVLMEEQGYEGIYQVASFHPMYHFGGTMKDDAANYTNRSIYPMLHLLRESDITKAVAHYPDPKGIPERNIAFAREKGVVFMKMLRDACL